MRLLVCVCLQLVTLSTPRVEADSLRTEKDDALLAVAKARQEAENAIIKASQSGATDCSPCVSALRRVHIAGTVQVTIA